MGETRVDLLHLLEDLRDAYPGSLEETILTEIVANALDSRATRIELRADAGEATLTVIDDGQGMTRGELRRFHDLAATSKRRGHGIGFAGVGIKLALLACSETVTESRRGKAHVASSWHLATRYKAPWKWVPPAGEAPSRGTAVRLHLAHPLSELLDSGYLEATLRRHFAPLFDPAFGAILGPYYPHGVQFIVNREVVSADFVVGARSEGVPIAVRVGRKRKPSAIGWIRRSLTALPEAEQGIAVSTLGKVIRRGWDWLAITPAAPSHITGLIEVPALAESLTLNKADFIRSGPRGATYLAYRKAIQEVVSSHLAEWGDTPSDGTARRSRTRTIERDVESVLLDLAGDFPLIAALVERRPGGQKRLALGAPAPHAAPEWAPARAVVPDDESAAAQVSPAATDRRPPEPFPDAARRAPGEAAESAAASGVQASENRSARKPSRYGLEIRFASRPDDPELGQLIESTVWVNEAHPAWQRAQRSRAEGYHIALTVAIALAPLAAEPTGAHAFITTFLECWGRAEKDGRRSKRKS